MNETDVARADQIRASLAKWTGTFPDAILRELTWLLDRLAAETAEVERLRHVQFSPPLGDNHHNAAMCPYCSPGGADLAAQLRVAQRNLAAETERADKAEAAILAEAIRRYDEAHEGPPGAARAMLVALAQEVADRG